MLMRSIVQVSIRSGLLPASMLVLAVACQASGGGSSTNGDGKGANSSTGGTPNLGNGGNLNLGNMGNSGPENTFAGEIRADAPNGEITVNGEVADVHLELYSADGSKVTEGIAWSVDDTKIGSISGDGTFHANGYVGGQVGITATVGNTSRTVYLTVNVDIINDEAKVTAADKTALAASGTADAKFKFLYPYDGTVFPRGLASPELQFAGTAPTVLYTVIELPYFKYQQYSPSVSPTFTRVKLPEPVWKGMTLTAAAADAVSLKVSKVAGGQVSGPVEQHYRIAQASMKGIIYYNTYDSPLTHSDDPNQKGGMMRIKAGGTAERVTQGCRVCHSVSADGSTLVASYGYLLPKDVAQSIGAPMDQWAPTPDRDYQPRESISYRVATTGEVALTTSVDNGILFPFSGLTPNGKKALSNGLPPDTWPIWIMRGVYSRPGYESQLLDTATGDPIAATGLGIKYAQTPAFSPDGKKVAFLNGDVVKTSRVLQTMDFDDASNTFSSPNVLVTGTEAMAWPTFLPDSSAVIYHAGDSFDSYEFGGPGTAPSKPQYAELRMVDAATKEVKKLNALNGRDAAGKIYLPGGEAVEGRMNYEANVLPVAVGGYYWVLFTSRRTYGNTLAPTGEKHEMLDPWGSDSFPSLRKKVWIAAIDVDHGAAPDPSHPAFYFPGQELEGGNMRAFAAMAPCQPDGGACESGSDCCGGYCRQTSAGDNGAPVLECVPPPMDECSKTDEPCVVAEDCCNVKELCINARCTLRSPPK